PGISGVTVWLYNDVNGDGQYDVGDTLYDTQVTDATGVYSFTGLLSGKYVVVVDEGSAALSGFTQTGDPDETSACGGLGACDAESGVILPNGGVNMTRDFGYQPATYLGDYIWLDSNRDGMQDATEIGLGNVVVILTPPGGVDLGKGAGNPISTTTNSDGYYTFGDLPDGTYTVQVDASTLPTTTLEATYEYNNTATPDGQVDVVINVSSGNSGGVATINGTSCSDCALDVDFGYDYPQGPYSLSGITFHDSYSAGTYDPPGDTAYPGVTVYLWMHTSGGNYTLINTTVSNGSGNFSFTDLYTGTYKATTSPVAPGGENITTPSQYTRLLNAANPTSTGNNFGFWTPSPTAVTLFDFKATPEGAGIQVTWETALEMDMLGFNLYRAEALGGAWTQLNVSLIPGRGSSGGSYVYTDNTAVPGVTYYYRLDIVASDSSVTYYGPVSATVIPDTWYHIYLPLIGR
ncbi:MAG: hypothetical protein KJ734_13950, partial [Chloroflexi bacterium]|nr:hypothetical protein [Chloroflexota bacterium]